MGGTFDPIHNGHLLAASTAAEQLDLEQVLFVPTGRPWQKANRTISAAEHRYLMTVIATAADPRFEVSRIEIDRPGPTYTVDTLRTLRDEQAGTQLHFITGSDTLADLATWHRADEVRELAHFVAVTRPGHEVPDEARAAGGGATGTWTQLQMPAVDISSSDIRARVASGRTIRYLVPAPVEQYIAKTGLYRQEAAR